jgi:hypothetical protein
MNRKLQLLALLVLAQVTLSTAIPAEGADRVLASNADTVNVTKVEIADDAGKVIAIVIKVIQIIAFFMLLADVFGRYHGKPRYFAHALRFIFFIYGACCPWLLGGNENFAPNGYRDLGDKMFFHFFDQIYHGYFGSGYIDCFNHKLTVDGNAYGFNYINILFFEMLGFFLLKTAAWATAKGLPEGNKWSHFLASLKGMYLEFFAFPFAGWAVFYFKQHFVLIDLADAGSKVVGRQDIVYYMSMVLAIYMTYEVALSCYELYEGDRDLLGSIPQEDQRIKEGQQQVPNTARSQVAVGNSTTQNSEKVADNCSVDALYLQYWLMFQYHHKSALNITAQYYNTIWILRWVVFAVFAIIWYKYPITLYVLYFLINVGMIIVTVIAKQSFRFAFKFILVEEILITIWHLAALINFIDYYGNGTMSQFLVNLTTHLMFWPYILTVIIETTLLAMGAIKNKVYFGAFPESMAKSEDLRVDLDSNKDLEAKIETYNTMKGQNQIAPESSTLPALKN